MFSTNNFLRVNQGFNYNFNKKYINQMRFYSEDRLIEVYFNHTLHITKIILTHPKSNHLHISISQKRENKPLNLYLLTYFLFTRLLGISESTMALKLFFTLLCQKVQFERVYQVFSLKVWNFTFYFEFININFASFWCQPSKTSTYALLYFI